MQYHLSAAGLRGPVMGTEPGRKAALGGSRNAAVWAPTRRGRHIRPH